MELALVVVCAAILALACPANAGKTTVDPNNTKPLAAAPVQAQPDIRLSQKVTYTATGKRLHRILDELSKQTGVTISAGKSPLDWQIRDLPVLVCVKDVPLRELLQHIADSTHLSLTSASVKGVKHYRILRDAGLERQLAGYYRKQREVLPAHAKWEWDGLVKYGQKYAGKTLADPALTRTRDLGNVLASLTPDQQESVFAGKFLRLTVKNTKPSVADQLKALYRSWWQERGQSYGRDLNDNEMAWMSLDIKLPDDSGSNLGLCMLQIPPGLVNNGRPVSIGSYDMLREEPGMPAGEPKLPDGPRSEYSPNLTKLDLDNPGSPVLDRKIKITRPKDGEDITYDDLIVQIAQAAKLSVVLEDFQNHRRLVNALADLPIYDRDITLGDALQAMRNQEWYSQPRVVWFTDTDSLILVGSLSDQRVRWTPETSWWAQHKALAPESLITGMVNKYNGDGLEIDDIVAAMLLPEDQRREWVFFNRDLFLWEPIPHTESFWRLYAGLSPEERALAKSPAGLSLGKLSPAVVQATFAESADLAEAEGLFQRGRGLSGMDEDPDLQKRMEEWQKQHYPELGRVMLGRDPMPVDMVQMTNDILADFPEIKAMWDIPTDIDVIRKLKMQLITKENEAEPALDENGMLVTKPLPEGSRTHSYMLVIQGDGINLRISPPMSEYPLYSEKRKKQLEEARKKAATNNKPSESAPNAQ